MKENKWIVLTLCVFLTIVMSAVIIAAISNSNHVDEKSKYKESSTDNNAETVTQNGTNPNPAQSDSSKKSSSSTSTGSTKSSTTPSSSSPVATSPSNPKVTSWDVRVFQKNLSCGTSQETACSMPAGLVLSIYAVNNANSTALPLKDCSITASPVGFSLPGGSWSANPSVYSDGGTPVCGGSFDFPQAGKYVLNNEVWLADSVNIDMPYRGGLLMYFWVKN